MFAVIWRMIVVRRAHALTVFLLATVAIGAAVAAPVFLDSARASLVQRELTAAPIPERLISARETVQVDNADYGQTTSGVAPHGFERQAATNMAVPGFRTVLSVATRVLIGQREPTLDEILDADPVDLVYRQDFCANVELTAGRCASGPAEVILPAAVAERFTLTVGDSFLATPVTRLSTGGREPVVFSERNGRTTQLSVVGLYQVRDPDSLYWGFAADGTMSDPKRLPIFITRAALINIPHNMEDQMMIAYPPQGALTVDTLEAVREGTYRAISATEGNVIPSSQMSNLFNRIDVALRSVVTAPFVGAVLLIALCWFVIFLAVAQAAQSRRTELGMMKLRGLSTGDQWWLAVAETAVPLCAGAVAGYLGAHAVVWQLATDQAGRDAVHLGLEPVPYAALALGGAILVSVAALRSDLGKQAAELMRRVPARGRAWQGISIMTIPVVLAVIAVLQVLTADDTQVGTADQSLLVLLAPALAILAMGMVVAVAFDAAMARLGSRLLRRGRLGAGLGMLHFGRRNNGSRLLGLLTVAVALLGFAAIGADVATDRRERQVDLAIGASRVLSIGTVSPLGLLTAVRQVDPTGEYAMAMVRNPIPSTTFLAVDSAALPNVALWPRDNARSAAQVAAELRPAALPDSTIVTGTVLRLTVDLTVDGAGAAVVANRVTPLDGQQQLTQLTMRIEPGERTYDLPIPCEKGCRLGDFALSVIPEEPPYDPNRLGPPPAPDPSSASIRLVEVRQGSPGSVVISPDQFANWVDRAGQLTLTPGADGLSIKFPRIGSGQVFRISPPDSPERLPLLSTRGDTGGSLTGTSLQVIAVKGLPAVANLPRIGTGSMVDLDTLIRADDSLPVVTTGEVWLSNRAPADVRDRLTAAGLVIVDERRQVDELAVASQSPSSVGMRFFLGVAFLGLVLAVAGLVVSGGLERSARADELRSLRGQGLPRRTAFAAGLWSYVIIICAATALGALIGKAAWALTGSVVPTGGTDAPAAPSLSYLGPVTELAWVGAAGALLITGIALAAALTAAAGRNPREATAAKADAINRQEFATVK